MFDFPAIARVLTAQAVAGSLGHSGERAVQAMVASAASSGAEVVGSGEEEDQSMSLLTAEVGAFYHIGGAVNTGLSAYVIFDHPINTPHQPNLLAPLFTL